MARKIKIAAGVLNIRLKAKRGPRYAGLIWRRWPNPVRDSGGQHDRRSAVISQIRGDARPGSFHPDQT
jgi:hypothetical protein